MKPKQVRRARVTNGDWERKELEGGPLSRELLTIKLIRLGAFIDRYGRRTLVRQSGFSELELDILIWVCETPPVSINDLAALVHRGAGQVSRAVQKLVAAGLLNRANRGGGPTVSITATAKGRAVYGPLVELTRKLDANVTHGLTRKDRPTFERCLASLTRDTIALLTTPATIRAATARASRIPRR